MPSSHKPRKDRFRQSKKAVVALVLFLSNLFVWAAFRGTEILLLTFITLLISGLAWFFAWRARREIKRSHGVVQGEGISLVAYWGSMVIFILSFFFFAWLLAFGILKGNFL